MKTIRYQLKTSKFFTKIYASNASPGGLRPNTIQFFMLLQKVQQIDNKQKFN